MTTPNSDSPILLGISTCLLGERVRFDANHKHDHYVTETLGRFFEFVPLCPEVAIGMGIPRPPIRLEGDPERPRVVGVRDKGLDVTDRLEQFSRDQVASLPEISGYILKSKSPSCGMERVKIYGPAGGIAGHGAGIFARHLMAAWPELPVEEEGRLGDPGLRDNFLERVFAYRRWQRVLQSGVSKQKLVDFHTTHKLSLMSHGVEHYRELGRMIADMQAQPLESCAKGYFRLFMKALAYQATVRKQTNVLHHLMGFVKRRLDGADKVELLEVIEAYRTERVPLVVPLTLLKHHLRKHPDPYVARQVYLNPEPAEMLLRRGGL